MNTKEIEKAVKVIKETIMPYMEADSNEKHYETLLTYIKLQLAQEYIAMKVFPEEKKIDWGAGRTIHQGLDYDAGFNEALNLCKLAMIKKCQEWKERVPSEKEIENLLDEWGKDNQAITKELGFRHKLSIAIHKLILERLGVKEER